MTNKWARLEFTTYTLAKWEWKLRLAS